MLYGVGREEGAADRRRPESVIPQKYVPHIRINYLTCGTNYAVTEAEGIEEIFRIVLELSDNMPAKADLLDNCGVGFLRSFLCNTNRKEDIDNCILAYESAVRLTTLSHSDMSSRLNIIISSLQTRRRSRRHFQNDHVTSAESTSSHSHT